MIAKMNQIPSHLHQSWPHEALQTERREKFLHCDAFYKRKCPRVWLKITFKRWPHLAFFLSLPFFSVVNWLTPPLPEPDFSQLLYTEPGPGRASLLACRSAHSGPGQPAVSPAVQWIMQQPDKFCSLNIEMREAKQTYTSTYMFPLCYSLALADMYSVECWPFSASGHGMPGSLTRISHLLSEFCCIFPSAVI